MRGGVSSEWAEGEAPCAVLVSIRMDLRGHRQPGAQPGGPSLQWDRGTEKRDTEMAEEHTHCAGGAERQVPMADSILKNGLSVGGGLYVCLQVKSVACTCVM